MWYGNKFKTYHMYWFVFSWVIYISINSISLESKVPCCQVSILIYPENYFEIFDLEICIIFIDALFPTFWNKLSLLIHLNLNCFSHYLVLCFTFLKIIFRYFWSDFFFHISFYFFHRMVTLQSLTDKSKIIQHNFKK